MSSNKQEYERLAAVVRELNEIIRVAEVTSVALRAQDVRDLANNEMNEMVARDLEANSGAYELVTKDSFRKKIIDLKRLKSDVDALVVKTGQAVQAAAWLAAVIKLLA